MLLDTLLCFVRNVGTEIAVQFIVSHVHTVVPVAVRLSGFSFSLTFVFISPRVLLYFTIILFNTFVP